MTRNTDRILVTHAGSLPRPDDLIEMVWAKMDGQEVDDDALTARVESAVAEVVRKQREAGVDIVSDGEMGRPGFSTYVEDRFTGFDGRSEFQADDVAPYPNLAMRLFATPAMAHIVFSNCVGPVAAKDPDPEQVEVDRLSKALGDLPRSSAFVGAISPGQIAFNYPDHHYGSHEDYLGALAEVLSHDYKTITDASKSIILGVIDVKSNCIEHPQVVADRLTRLAKIVGRERVLAGTDCGFDTFIRFSQVDPDVAWEKLRALSRGAELASGELW